MAHEQIQSTFTATADKGEVTSLLLRPKNAQWLLVLGHGASTNCTTAPCKLLANN